MTKKNGKKNPKKPDRSATASNEGISNAWIPYRTGIIIIAILSIGMAAMTVYQAVNDFGKPLAEAIFLGVFFGGMLWVVFFGFILLNRLLGRH